MEKWRNAKKFDSALEFEEMLKKRFPQLKGDVTFGYIEPGHGLKGRQHWITDDDELRSMYKLYSGKKEIIIWCYLTDHEERKHHHKQEPTSKRSGCVIKNEQALEDVKVLVVQLRSKHGNNYTPEQFNAWGQ